MKCPVCDEICLEFYNEFNCNRHYRNVLKYKIELFAAEKFLLEIYESKNKSKLSKINSSPPGTPIVHIIFDKKITVKEYYDGISSGRWEKLFCLI